MVQHSGGSRVYSLGFRVQGSQSRVLGSRWFIEGPGFRRVQGSGGFTVEEGLRFRRALGSRAFKKSRVHQG